jgi:Rieske Fe-S protein
MSDSQADDPGRRRFLNVCTAAAGACVGGLAVAPVVAQLFGPAGKRTVSAADGLLDLGPVGDFVVGVPRKVVVRGPGNDAWMTSEDELGPVHVLRRADGTFSAFSAICPHLGCAVDYVPQTSKFFCPCHDTTFASDGAVEEGPSPRGLDPLEATVEKERVLLRFRRFRLGGADRVEV